MRFSVHNKFSGGFDYYDVPDSVAINDDHPVPVLSPMRTKLGVPATRAGRPLPDGARAAGRGELPMGSISSGKAGSWSSGGGLPSGLGLAGVSWDIPCPSATESAFIGGAIGAVFHLGVGGSDKSRVRGLALVLAGSALGYFFGNRACFWRQ